MTAVRGRSMHCGESWGRETSFLEAEAEKAAT